MNNRILVVTNCGDVHADLVIERITARGESAFRLNLDEFPACYALNLELMREGWGGTISHLPSGNTISVQDIRAIWTRKPASFSFSSDSLSVQEEAYAAAEIEHVLSGLLHGLDCYWMSHPKAIRAAQWKLEQLVRANRLGFRVPASLVTDRPDSVRRFRGKSVDGVVFKPLSSSFLAADMVRAEECVTAGLATTLIDDQYDEMLDSVSELPSFFQQHIPKLYELRVTVIDSLVFAAKIHSQENELTKMDFRDFSAKVRYEATQLSAEIEDKCRAYVKSYGLNFGALDLIFTPEGEYVFLENNPAGQFLFIEQLVPELKMIDAVAECLIEGAKQGKASP